MSDTPGSGSLDSMTPEDIRLVDQTSSILLAVGTPVADAFYTRLFELEPDARLMFDADLTTQKLKLTNMLASLIGALKHADLFQSIIVRIGQDHAELAVQRHHYVSGGIALMAALERGLGTQFTPDVRSAWRSLYACIQDRMIVAGGLH